MPAVPPAPAEGPVAVEAVAGVSSVDEGRSTAGVAWGRPGRLIGGGVGFFFVSSFAGMRTALLEGLGSSSAGGFSILGFSAAGGGAGAGAAWTWGARIEPARSRRTATARGLE